MKIDQELEKALKKKALGYEATETVEEFSEQSDGEIKLVKRKVTTKDVPPDLTAVRLFIELNGDISDISAKTEEELIAEKNELIKLIKEKGEDDKEV